MTQSKESHNFVRPATDFLTGELFQHAYGTAWFGFDSLGADTTHINDLDSGFSLSSSGFVLDPRLWSQIVSLNLDHFSSGQGGSRNLGYYMNGTLLRKRSFPLRVTLLRRAADSNSLDFQNHNTYHAMTLDWMLKQPKIAVIGVTATFSGTEQDDSSQALPTLGSTVESEQNLDAHISRNFWGWSVTGTAFDYNIRGNSNNSNQSSEYQEISKGASVIIQRTLRLGENGELRTSAIHESRDVTGFSQGFSSFAAPATSFSYTNARAIVDYRHSKKFRGSYEADYLSNLTQQALVSGIGAFSPGALNPGVVQALSTPIQTSSIQTHAGWNYRVTDNLAFNFGAGHTNLEMPAPALTQTQLIPSFEAITGYTTIDGGVSYTRKIGKWETNWGAIVTHNWDEVRQGGGFEEDSRTVAIGVARKIDRFYWKSDFSIAEYTPGREGLTARREERWSNKLQTHFRDGLQLDLNADLVRSNLNVSYPALMLLTLQGEKSSNTMLLMRATLSSRRFDVGGGTGLRYLDARNLFEVSNPLLVPSTTSADHYADLFASYKVRSTLSFRGAYRRDDFEVSTGDSTRFSGIEFSFAYQLKRLTVEGGYERQKQDMTGRLFSRNLFYLRIRRPFRLY